VTWQNYLNGGNNWHIYVQRVNAAGVVQWAANGVAICTATGDQYEPELISDGAGGAIITWYEYSGGYYVGVFAQRVNAAGAIQWTLNGVAMGTPTGDQQYPEIIPDGAGGAIIAWQDRRGGTYDIYAQRVNATGVVQWAAYGVAICTAAGSQGDPQLTSDGTGGAIITWVDARDSYFVQAYVQRVNASGAVQWTPNGVAICTVTYSLAYPQIVSDGAGGAIITWEDHRSYHDGDIRAQCVDALGGARWVANGVAVCDTTGESYRPHLTSDGAGGAIITWYDYRGGSGSNIYAQRAPAGIVDVPMVSKVETRLSQNAPNPFNPVTNISFSVAAPGEVSLRIYDIAGRVTRTLVDGWREPGVYSEVWDGRDEDGRALPSGVYFYSLKAGEVEATHKMVLLK
jgi:hypothetical protein